MPEGCGSPPRWRNGEAVNEKAVSYEIYSDERDQYGQRTKVMSAAKPGLVIRLNAGIYNVVGTYGDANAVARADVTVEAGKLTEATLSHAAGEGDLQARRPSRRRCHRRHAVERRQCAGRGGQGKRGRAADACLRARHLYGQRQERRRGVPAHSSPCRRGRPPRSRCCAGEASARIGGCEIGLIDTRVPGRPGKPRQRANPVAQDGRTP